MHRLWKEIASASGAKVFALFTGIATLALTGRLLGPAGRGTIVAITTWVSLISTFGCLSLGQVAIHRATNARDRSWLGPTLGSLLLLTGIITAAGWLAAGCLFVVTRRQMFHDLPLRLLVLGFLMLPFMVWEQYGSSLLIAIDQLRIYNRAQVFGRAAGLVLIVALLWFLRWREAAAIAALLAAQAVISLAGIQRLWTEAGQHVWPDRDAIAELVRGGIKLHLNSIGALLVLLDGHPDYQQVPRAGGDRAIPVGSPAHGHTAPDPAGRHVGVVRQTTQIGPDGVWKLKSGF